MTRPTEAVRAEFDRIARASPPNEGWNHNNHYHAFLLRHAPLHCVNALEIGCGMGEFARLLAQRSDHVLALDLSPEMIRIARERSAGCANIDFQVGDVLAWDFADAQFDCIASIATLHHLELGNILAKLKAALKPGGVLLVLDLYQAASMTDQLWAGLGVPVNLVLQAMKPKGAKPSPESQAAWQAHGSGDSYLTIPQVRGICAALLPGTRVRKHLLWRYSMVWKKPQS